MIDDFFIGMKVSLDEEVGLIVDPPNEDTSDLIGWILWDTPSKQEFEDWRGLFGTFIQTGGKILPSSFKFQHLSEKK